MEGSCPQDGVGDNEQFSLFSLAEVGQTLATLLNNSARLMPVVPTFHTLLISVHTQSHAQCPGMRAHSIENISVFQSHIA